MTLAHPEIKRIIEGWQAKLRELTGNETVFILAYSPPTMKYNLKDLVPIVCEETGIPFEKLMKKNRQTEVVQARQLLSYYGSMCGFSLTVVARELGLADHSSVIHGRDKIKDLIETGDEAVCNLVVKINKRLEERNGTNH